MIKRLTLILSFAIGLSGCLYKMDIHQGNVLDPEQIAQLKLGMSKNEVISIIGSPQLTDPFHTQRWDYYSMSNLNNQKVKVENLMTLNFEGEQLIEIIRGQLEDLPAKKEEKEY